MSSAFILRSALDSLRGRQCESTGDPVYSSNPPIIVIIGGFSAATGRKIM
jgi:hypothetical protein